VTSLQLEFIQYQTDEMSDDITTSGRVDKQWHLIGQLKDANLNLKYTLLPKLMKAILAVFHSNADCERIFSFVTKTKTKERASMSTKTLTDLVVQKQYMLAKNVKCFEKSNSNALLRKCKSATYNDLK
jgi:hypothetical protein